LPDVRLTYVPYIKGVTSAIKTLSKIKKDNQQFSDFLDVSQKTLQMKFRRRFQSNHRAHSAKPLNLPLPVANLRCRCQLC
jgi:hypothetical protein